MKTTDREQIFAKRLKEMRKKRGITQTELAKKLDCEMYDLLT